jgi:hypothetical protein
MPERELEYRAIDGRITALVRSRFVGWPDVQG